MFPSFAFRSLAVFGCNFGLGDRKKRLKRIPIMLYCYDPKHEVPHDRGTFKFLDSRPTTTIIFK